MLQQSIRRLLPSGLLHGQAALLAKQGAELSDSLNQGSGLRCAASSIPSIFGDLRQKEEQSPSTSLPNTPTLPLASRVLLPGTPSMKMPFGLTGSGLLASPRLPMPGALSKATTPQPAGVRTYVSEGEMVASAYLLTTDIMFWSGLIGAVVFRRNLIVMLLCTEIVMLACNMNFLFASAYLNDMTGVIMSITITTIAACETAIGLALCVTYYHLRSATDVEALNLLK